MPAGDDQEGDAELQQGDQCGGVSLMLGGNKPHGIAFMLGALALLALPMAAGRAQTAVTSAEIIEKLAVEAESDLDLAVLKQQATDRIKARADAQPQKRPPIAPQLTKLPQIRFDIVFDPDSSLIRPASYQTIGSIADALTDPKMRPYRYLIVDHVESAGRRDHNLILSQRRADSIRDVLVNTFKVSPKRLLALGLGEEQLQDVNRPAAPANARVQLMAFGKFETADPAKPATPAAAAPKGAAAAKKKKR
jgi:outer membrane protein OmpA-like peptidoglycan-associated protein